MLLEKAFLSINNEEKKKKTLRNTETDQEVCVQKTTSEQNLFDSGPWLRCCN